MIRLFPTQIYAEKLSRDTRKLNRDLLHEAYRLRAMDDEGREWCRKNYPGGYTSYSSLSKLNKISSTFEALAGSLDRHVMKYAKALDLDLRGRELSLTNLWVNIVPKGVYHGLHLHPLATISGTYYVSIPRGTPAGLKFEDPRMACFMASPPRTDAARLENRRFWTFNPKAGQVVLFESWLRHEVEQNQSREDRVSVSFNYNWF